MKKLTILSLLLSCVLFGGELADALRGRKSQVSEQQAAQTKKQFAEKVSCDKIIIDTIADNNISYFRGQKEKLKEINDCLINGDMTPVMLAAYIDRPTILTMFLDAGVSVDDRSSKDYTALHFAAFYGNYEAVQILLSKGADINAQNDAGQTPLIIASRFGNAKTVKILLQKGADEMIRDKKGYNAKDLAIEYHKKEVLAVFGK